MLTHTAATREEQLRESQVLRSAHGRHGARLRIRADATGEAKAEDDESHGRSRTEAREGKAGLAHCEAAKATELTGPPEVPGKGSGGALRPIDATRRRSAAPRSRRSWARRTGLDAGAAYGTG